MKTTRILFLVVLWLSGSVLFNTCQNEEFDDQTLSSTGDDYISEEDALRESALLVIENQSACINPDDPVYVENTQQETAQWGNPKSPFIKTVDIAYYNTLTHFVLKVKSTHGFADLLIDEISVWVDDPVSEDQWGEYSVELPIGWAADDVYSFALKVAGFGPPAFFGVEYHLIGECVNYTLSLAVNPLGAGAVTGDGDYMEGEEVALTATANEGWIFVNWTDENNAEISAVANFSYTMPAMNKTLTANFEEEEVFVCGVSTVMDIDGNEYATILMTYGTQCWFAENLKTTRYRNGDAIPGNLSDIDWKYTTVGAYAIYDHSHGSAAGVNSEEEMFEAYGVLYNWYAVGDQRGLCPAGWHVSTDFEWWRMADWLWAFYGNYDVQLGQGNALKSCRQVESPLGGECATTTHPRWNANIYEVRYGFDAYGFSGLPAGDRASNGWWVGLGSIGWWWTSDWDPARAIAYALERDDGRLRSSVIDREAGFSVRCVKD